MSDERIKIVVRCGFILKQDLREALGMRHSSQWKALIDNMEGDSETFAAKYCRYRQGHSVTVGLARDILSYVDEDYENHFKIEYNAINLSLIHI